MTTLYATDLDGTLLNSQARLSDSSARMLEQLRQMGVMVTYITARTPATVEPIMKNAPASMLPAVVMTGAAIWNQAQRRYESVAYHNAGDVKKIIEICRRCGVHPFVYTLQRGANALKVYQEATTLTDIEHRFVVDRTLNDLKTFNLHTCPPDETADCTVLFFAMGDYDVIQAAAAEIRSATNCYASCYPDTYNQGICLLEVFTQGVSKAEGLRQLKRLVGVDRVVAFGDNLNDIPMLQAADVAVAVANAHPEVKAVADIVIDSADNDAVPKYIINQNS